VIGIVSSSVLFAGIMSDQEIIIERLEHHIRRWAQP